MSKHCGECYWFHFMPLPLNAPTPWVDNNAEMGWKNCYYEGATMADDDTCECFISMEMGRKCFTPRASNQTLAEWDEYTQKCIRRP